MSFLGKQAGSKDVKWQRGGLRLCVANSFYQGIFALAPFTDRLLKKRNFISVISMSPST